MDKYDGEKCSFHGLDEIGQWAMPSGKQFKIGNLFCLYYEKYFFWFRLFGKYGISGKSLKKKWFVLFSERYGYRKTYKLLGWKLEFLK